MSLLGDYLGRVGRERWQWGTRDCCTFLADWCMVAGYPDPMAFIRGEYDAEPAAMALAKRPGLVKLASKGFSNIGLERTKGPLDGDVAVIRRPTEDGQGVVCAIRSAERWVTLMERGLVVDEGGDLLRAWRVEWARP